MHVGARVLAAAAAVCMTHAHLPRPDSVCGVHATPTAPCCLRSLRCPLPYRRRQHACCTSTQQQQPGRCVACESAGAGHSLWRTASASCGRLRRRRTASARVRQPHAAAHASTAPATPQPAPAQRVCVQPAARRARERDHARAAGRAGACVRACGRAGLRGGGQALVHVRGCDGSPVQRLRATHTSPPMCPRRCWSVADRRRAPQAHPGGGVGSCGLAQRARVPCPAAGAGVTHATPAAADENEPAAPSTPRAAAVHHRCHNPHNHTHPHARARAHLNTHTSQAPPGYFSLAGRPLSFQPVEAPQSAAPHRAATAGAGMGRQLPACLRRRARGLLCNSAQLRSCMLAWLSALH
jgi:hypothetical protein